MSIFGRIDTAVTISKGVYSLCETTLHVPALRNTLTHTLQWGNWQGFQGHHINPEINTWMALRTDILFLILCRTRLAMSVIGFLLFYFYFIVLLLFLTSFHSLQKQISKILQKIKHMLKPPQWIIKNMSSCTSWMICMVFFCAHYKNLILYNMHQLFLKHCVLKSRLGTVLFSLF